MDRDGSVRASRAERAADDGTNTSPEGGSSDAKPYVRDLPDEQVERPTRFDAGVDRGEGPRVPRGNCARAAGDAREDFSWREARLEGKGAASKHVRLGVPNDIESQRRP